MTTAGRSALVLENYSALRLAKRAAAQRSQVVVVVLGNGSGGLFGWVTRALAHPVSRWVSAGFLAGSWYAGDRRLFPFVRAVEMRSRAFTISSSTRLLCLKPSSPTGQYVSAAVRTAACSASLEARQMRARVEVHAVTNVRE